MRTKLTAIGCATSVLALATTVIAGEYSDPGNTFTLSAGDSWKPVDKRPSAVAVMLQGTATPPSKIAPIVTAFSPPDIGKAPLQMIAEETVNSAKERVPDQKGLGEVKVVQVDGEDAREATFLMKSGDAQVKLICRFTRHAGKLYIFQTITGEDGFDKLKGEFDAILSSVKWKK